MSAFVWFRRDLRVHEQRRDTVVNNAPVSGGALKLSKADFAAWPPGVSPPERT